MSSTHNDSPDSDDRYVAREQQVALDVTAVAKHLAGANLAFDPDVLPRQFRGGLANINYLVHVNDTPMVLRRPPGGELPRGAHDMGREHRILSRLWQALPLAPRSVYLCEDRDVIGVPFQLIEYRDGVIARGDTLSGLGEVEVVGPTLGNTLIETLAAVHAVDPAVVDLHTLGRPQGFLDRAVHGWCQRGESIATSEQRLIIDELGDWLQRKLAAVPGESATLLHCDFKLDNLILDAQSLAPVAIIDWDMGTRGHPLFDLCTLLSYWSDPDDPQCMHDLKQMPTARGGFMSREQAAQAYLDRTGVSAQGLTAVRVLCQFKLAVVFLQLYARYRDGALVGDAYRSFEQLGHELLVFSLDVKNGRWF